jgi:hypothetical protein
MQAKREAVKAKLVRENKGTTNSKMAVCARACVHGWSQCA